MVATRRSFLALLATTVGYGPSWIRGNEMDAHIASRPDTTRLDPTHRGRVKVGDVVVFDWDPQNNSGVDHTMLASRADTHTDGTNAIKLAGHTIDTQDRDFDTAITSRPAQPGAV